jgi:hypothetical protein
MGRGVSSLHVGEEGPTRSQGGRGGAGGGWGGEGGEEIGAEKTGCGSRMLRVGEARGIAGSRCVFVKAKTERSGA